MTNFLVTMTDESPFVIGYFDPENHFVPGVGMVVYDLNTGRYTDDGQTWKDILVTQHWKV